MYLKLINTFTFLSFDSSNDGYEKMVSSIEASNAFVSYTTWKTAMNQERVANVVKNKEYLRHLKDKVEMFQLKKYKEMQKNAIDANNINMIPKKTFDEKKTVRIEELLAEHGLNMSEFNTSIHLNYSEVGEIVASSNLNSIDGESFNKSLDIDEFSEIQNLELINYDFISKKSTYY